jgi:hypothetical protein
LEQEFLLLAPCFMLDEMNRIKFITKETKSKRRHYLTRADVEILLSRLPESLWKRVREVYFNDRARGNRVYGYVTRGHRAITICALPNAVSLGRCVASYRQSSTEFGGPERGQWPETAIRRFLLYDVFLHELGHLQIVRAHAKYPWTKFAGEKLAQVFANDWRRNLWSNYFDHPDPIHNSPQTYNPVPNGMSLQTL